MDLYMEILSKVLESREVNMVFPNLRLEATQIVELTCYRALQEIKAVIEDESLEDDACFWKIEKIVRLFEKMGSNGGFRHDFG